MNKILITGAAGFIGSHVANQLILDGYKVDVVDNLCNGRLQNILHLPEELNWAYIKSFDDEEVLNAIRNKQYDYVYHFAALPRVSYSIDNLELTHDVNVTKTVRLIEACKGNIKRFVFASSSSVYGGATQLPTPEYYPKAPKSPYALQKSIIEDYLKQYWMHYGMDSVSLRLFNVFGPGQLGDSPYSCAISAWCNAIYEGEELRSDGTGDQSRDLCYVDNVVFASQLLIKHQEQLKGDCFNIACCERTSNNVILSVLQSRFKNLKIRNAPARKGDVMHTQACYNKAKNIFGYYPKVKFWDGFEKTLAWWDLNDK